MNLPRNSLLTAALGLTLAASAPAATVGENSNAPEKVSLCDHPDLKALPKRRMCRTVPVLYRHDGKIEDAELAIVDVGVRRRDDVIDAILINHLRTSEDGIVRLGSFPSEFDGAPHQISYQLGYEYTPGGGFVVTDHAILYDRFIEKIGDRYCSVYRMKSPLTGEFHNCDGKLNPGGEVGYLPGTIIPREARERIHAYVAGQPCLHKDRRIEVVGNYLQRDADGTFHYRLEVTVTTRLCPERTVETNSTPGMRVYAIPADTSRYTYRLDAIGGTITLLERKSATCEEEQLRLLREYPPKKLNENN